MSEARTVWISYDGALHKVVLRPDTAPQIDGKALQADATFVEPGVLSLLVTEEDGRTRSFRCMTGSSPEGEVVLIDGLVFPYQVADPRSLRGRSASLGDTGPRPLKSPMPGRIVRLLVTAGETVQAGQGCVVVEAMKMQNELKAPRPGVVGKVSIAVGDVVAAGAVLLIVE